MYFSCMLGTRPPGDPACEAAGRKVSGVRCVYLTRYRPRLLEVASVRCSRSSPKSDFLVLIGQIQGAHESAEQHPMGRDPSGAPKTVQRLRGSAPSWRRDSWQESGIVFTSA